MYKHSTVEERECVCEKSSTQWLITGICSSSTISVIISVIITAVVLRLLLVMRCKRRRVKNSNPKSVPNVNGPLYEEIEITNKENALNLSQNAAYQSVLKKV